MTTWRRTRALEGLALGSMVVLGTVVPADRPVPFPVCAWNALTGINCPGCGFTRAVCHALQGDIAGSVALHITGPAAALALVAGTAWLLADAVAGRPLGPGLRAAVVRAGLWGGGVVSVASWAAMLAGWR